MPITCPHCGQESELPFDTSEGTATLITDCEVCCRPMNVTVRVQDGEVESVEVTPA